MLKLGSVSYINALPLTSFLDPKEFEIIHLPPAELLSLLKNGKVDAALLPIVNYFENPELYLIPNIAIASKGAVKSVQLFFDSENLSIQNVKNIYLDPESRTSQLLLKVLLRDFYHISLEKICFDSDLNSSEIQAKLLIGDKALVKSGSSSLSLDLGEVWWNWQKKPFVFAAWMTKNPQMLELSELLKKSRDHGLKNIEKIIAQIHFPLTPTLSPVERGKEEFSPLLNDYFTKNLHYYMGNEELEGIQTFFKHLKNIQGYTHELNFRFVS